MPEFNSQQKMTSGYSDLEDMLNGGNEQGPDFVRPTNWLSAEEFIDQAFDYDTHVCPHCNEVYLEPHLLISCGHKLCLPCIKTLWQQSRKCPEDGKDFTPNLTELDEMLKEDIFSLMVRCKFHEAGCEWQGSFFEYIRNHSFDCAFKDKADKERMTGGRSPTGSTRSQASNGQRENSPGQQSKHFPTTGLFVFPLMKKYICPCCEDPLRYPVQISACGHRLCSKCYNTLLSTSTARCPVDQMDLDDKLPCPDKAFNDEILGLEVKCANSELGCKWEGSVKEFSDHAECCEFLDILCRNDCGAKFQKRFLEKHLQKDCPKVFIQCSYCDERHMREEKKEHLSECPQLPLPCPNKCDKKLTISRSELDAHVENDCPRTKMMCSYEDIGCQHRCSREKMPKHNKVEIINHLKLLYDVVMTNQEKLASHEEKLKENELTIQRQDKRIGDLERVARSQLIWRIDDLNRKMKEAKAGNCDTLFSPPFVTSKFGYRLCASVCLNGDGKGKGTHISVFISILKGAFDALLKWPFDYRVTFQLLDQTSDPSQRKHIKLSIKPNPCTDNEPFLGRPKLEKNASFGGAKFAKHEEVLSKNATYVNEDCIFFKINVDSDGSSEP